jgi:hypothetical protein
MEKDMRAMVQALRKAILDAEPTLVAKRYPDESTRKPTRLESLQHALSVLDTIEGEDEALDVRFTCACAVVGIMMAHNVDPRGYSRKLH